MYGDEVPTSIDQIEAYCDAWALIQEAEWMALKAKSTCEVEAPSLTEICS